MREREGGGGDDAVFHLPSSPFFLITLSHRFSMPPVDGTPLSRASQASFVVGGRVGTGQPRCRLARAVPLRARDAVARACAAAGGSRVEEREKKTDGGVLPHLPHTTLFFSAAAARRRSLLPPPRSPHTRAEPGPNGRRPAHRPRRCSWVRRHARVCSTTSSGCSATTPRATPTPPPPPARPPRPRSRMMRSERGGGRCEWGERARCRFFDSINSRAPPPLPSLSQGDESSSSSSSSGGDEDDEVREGRGAV